jgi:hypothetical protein
MKRRDFICVVTAATVLGGCTPFPAIYKIQYKLTIALKVGGRVYEGSSVNLTRYTLNRWMTGFDGVGAYHGQAWGEAVCIDLERLGLLFGVLQPPLAMGGFSAKDVAEVLLPILPVSQRSWDSIKSGQAFENAQKLRGEYDVARAQWPVLVRFRDVHKKETAELVTPADIHTLYGQDAEITMVRIAISEAPLSTGIEKKLPWLLNEDRRVDTRSTITFQDSISRFNFVLD